MSEKLNIIRKSLFLDSVALMRISKQLLKGEIPHDDTRKLPFFFLKYIPAQQSYLLYKRNEYF